MGAVQEITARALADWLNDASRPAPHLLDVREEWEYAHCHLANSQLMPMHTVPLHMNSLPDDAPLVVICHHGGRSMQVAMFLERQGLGEVINLAGGVAQWAQQVDPAMPQY
jgi:rhodanese-related sulfurtransferase